MGCRVTSIMQDAFDGTDVFSVSAPYGPEHYGFVPDENLEGHWFVSENGDGGLVVFGSMKPYRNAKESEPLEWLVIEDAEDSLLLITRYVLPDSGGRYLLCSKAPSWETSELREWLNTDFLDSAFTAEEKERMLPVLLPVFNYPDEAVFFDEIFSYRKTDLVTLLDETEVDKYFPKVKTRIAYSSANSKSTWWLRGPIKGSEVKAVFFSGEYRDEPCFNEEAVRPVIRIRKQ